MPQQVMTPATEAEVRHLCGDVLDWKLGAILELLPTAEDVATAVAWAGGHDELGEAGHPLEGKAAQVYDVLTADEFGDEQE